MGEDAKFPASAVSTSTTGTGEPPSAPKALQKTGSFLVTRATFWLWRVVPATLIFALVDSAGSSVSAQGLAERTLVSLGIFAYALPLFLLIAFASSFCLAVFDAVRKSPSNVLSSGDSRRGLGWDAAAALLPALAFLILLVAWVAYLAATRFHNHRLSSLLVALVAVVAVGAGVIIQAFAAFVIARVRTRFERRRRVATIAVRLGMAIPLLAVITFQVRLNRDGFDILGPWMSAGPFIALVVFGGLLLRAPVPTKTRARAVWFAYPIALVLSLSASIGMKGLPGAAVKGGLWSGVLIQVARKVTDVDRDGASSFFGDGDCAPLDKNIHPLAIDEPGDGVDSNCFGGDAKPRDEDQPPPWYDDAPGIGQPKNFLLVTIETLRADRLSLYGYDKPTTPHLEALAKDSVVFTHTYSASPGTTLSLPALFTTLTPSQIKIKRYRRGNGVDPSVAWVPEILSQAGFTAGASVVRYLRGWGYKRGFGTHYYDTADGLKGPTFNGFPSGEVVDKTIKFIDGVNGKRFFAWAHLVEPHAVYERAEWAPNFGESEQGRYDSEIWEADRQVGRLVEHLTKAGLLDETVILLTGDHGEAFGEHGERFHFTSVHEAQVRTLGMLYVPGLGGVKVEQPVNHQDLMTTAINVLGVNERFSELRGRNLVPALRGTRVEPAEFFVEIAGLGVPKPVFALVDWPFKLIYNHTSKSFELYNIEEDPGETTDVQGPEQAVFASMKEKMTRHVEAGVTKN